MKQSNTRRRRPRQGASDEASPPLVSRNKMMLPVCCILAIATWSPSDAFSMVAPPSSVARPPPPAWTTALYHPEELNEGRVAKQNSAKDTATNRSKKTNNKKDEVPPEEMIIAAHASHLFLADPTGKSHIPLSQQILEPKAFPKSVQDAIAKSTSLRNLAGFVVQEFDSQQLAKGRALLLSQKQSEPNTRTIGDVQFAQDSLQDIWRVAGEAVVDFGLNHFDFDAAERPLKSVDLGEDGAFQVEPSQRKE